MEKLATCWMWENKEISLPGRCPHPGGAKLSAPIVSIQVNDPFSG